MQQVTGEHFACLFCFCDRFVTGHFLSDLFLHFTDSTLVILGRVSIAHCRAQVLVTENVRERDDRHRGISPGACSEGMTEIVEPKVLDPCRP